MHRIHHILRIVKGDVRHLPRVVTLTIASMAVYNFGWGFADPFFSIYLSQFATNYAEIGFFQMLMTIITALLLIPVGAVLDRANNQRVMIAAKIGYFFVAVLYFLAAEFHSVGVLVAALLLNGALIPLVWAGTASTIIRHTPKKEAGLAFGLYMTTRQLAWVIGLAIGLWVVWQFPIHYIFIPVMICPLLSIVFHRPRLDSQSKPLRTAIHDVVVKEKMIVRVLQEMRAARKDLWAVYGLFFLSSLIQVITFVYVPLYAASLGYSFTKIGLLVLIMNIPYVLSFITAEVSDHAERLRTIIIGIAISAVSVGLLSIWGQEDWHLFVFSFFMVAGYAILVPAFTSMISTLTPKGYAGTNGALGELVMHASPVLFAPLIGLLIDTEGWSVTFLSVAVCLTAIMLGVALYQMSLKRRSLLYTMNHPKSRHNPYIV